MAKRRSLEDVLKDATTFAKKKPFTAQELAAHLGVTPNRARQVLDDLAKNKVVADLGKRKSMRGKPATLWGAPGTKLSDADVAARPPPRRKGRKATRAATPKAGKGGRIARGAASVDTRAFDAAVSRLEALLDRVVDEGVVIEGPGGLEFTLKLAGGAKPKRRATKGRSTRGKKRPAKKRAAKKRAAKKRATKKKSA